MIEQSHISTDQRDFGSTTMSHERLSAKLDWLIEPFNQLLNSHLRVLDYGSNTKRVAFIFIAFDDNSHKKNDIYFYPEKEKLTIELLLEAQTLAEADEIEFRHIAIQTLIDYLDQLTKADIVHINTNKPLPHLDFNIEQFRKDLKETFEQAGWLNSEKVE